MAEKENNGQEPEAPKKKKGLLIVILILSQLIIAAGLVIFIIYPKFAGNEGAKEDEAVKKKTEEKAYQLGPTLTISDLTVNPKGSMGRRFAVFEVVLEMNDPTFADKINQLKPVIVDKFLSYLREKTVAEFSSSEQMKIIRNDLKKIVNAALNEDAVKNLYFTRYVLE